MSYKTGRLLKFAVLGAALACLAAPAKAAPVDFPIFAEIGFANANGHISVGQVGQGIVTYDDSTAITGAGFTRFFITDLSLTFPDASATGGASTWEPTSFGAGDLIFFTDPGGEFAGVTLSTAMPSFDAWGVDDMSFTGNGGLPVDPRNFILADATFDGGVSGELSQVPLPAAAWLFLGGLAALAGVRGRRRAAAAQA